MTKNSSGIPFLCKINEPQTIHIMKVRFLYLLCLLTCILPACSSDDNEPVDEPVYGHEIEMYTVEQGKKRDKRQ